MDEKLFNSWKQPIPTTLDQIFRGDYFCKFIFIELLLRARTREEQEIRGHERKDLIFLKRGQCVCGEEELGNMFNKSRQWARLKLQNLQNLYTLIDIQGTAKGTVVTIKSFDEITKLDSLTYKEKTSKRQPKDTNKNVKSEEDCIDLTERNGDVLNG